MLNIIKNEKFIARTMQSLFLSLLPDQILCEKYYLIVCVKDTKKISYGNMCLADIGLVTGIISIINNSLIEWNVTINNNIIQFVYTDDKLISLSNHFYYIGSCFTYLLDNVFNGKLFDGTYFRMVGDSARVFRAINTIIIELVRPQVNNLYKFTLKINGQKEIKIFTGCIVGGFNNKKILKVLPLAFPGWRLKLRDNVITFTIEKSNVSGYSCITMPAALNFLNGF